MIYQEVCKSMSSQEITTDAGELEQGVKQHSATTEEWSAREINETEEVKRLPR